MSTIVRVSPINLLISAIRCIIENASLQSPDAFDGMENGRSLSRYYDDSQYPSSKGALFFSDCLSSKNKAHLQNQD